MELNVGSISTGNTDFISCNVHGFVLNNVATVQWHFWGTGCQVSHHRKCTSQNSIMFILLLGRFQAILLKTRSVLLGEVPALPGVVQAYVQVGTGRGAPRWLPVNAVIIPTLHVMPSALHIWLFSPLFLISILFHVHSKPRLLERTASHWKKNVWMPGKTLPISLSKFLYTRPYSVFQNNTYKSKDNGWEGLHNTYNFRRLVGSWVLETWAAADTTCHHCREPGGSKT